MITGRPIADRQRTVVGDAIRGVVSGIGQYHGGRSRSADVHGKGCQLGDGAFSITRHVTQLDANLVVQIGAGWDYHRRPRCPRRPGRPVVSADRHLITGRPIADRKRVSFGDAVGVDQTGVGQYHGGRGRSDGVNNDGKPAL